MHDGWKPVLSITARFRRPTDCRICLLCFVRIILAINLRTQARPHLNTQARWAALGRRKKGLHNYLFSTLIAPASECISSRPFRIILIIMGEQFKFYLCDSRTLDNARFKMLAWRIAVWGERKICCQLSVFPQEASTISIIGLSWYFGQSTIINYTQQLHTNTQ